MAAIFPPFSCARIFRARLAPGVQRPGLARLATRFAITPIADRVPARRAEFAAEALSSAEADRQALRRLAAPSAFFCVPAAFQRSDKVL